MNFGEAEQSAAVAAFAVLLSRWTGRREVEVMVHRDGATRPVRTVLSSAMPFSALADRVHASLVAAPAEPVPAHDLVLRLDTGELVCRPGRFSPERMTELAGAYAGLCARVAEDPSVRLHDLDALGPHRLRELLHTRNATDTPYRYSEHTLHRLVEDAVDGHPDAVAVECGERRLTFLELETEANRLAHHLIATGVGPEVPVCVLLDRSVEVLVALLGVLKAGGCYVPLEPSYPAPRLAFMAGETGAPILLTRSDLAARAPEGGWTVLCLDTDRPAIARRPAARPATSAGPDNLAYVIYTSGSTGRPKGVMVPHRGVVHYLAWCGWKYEAGRGAGAPVHSPLSFDLTVTGLFLPLMYGRTVTLIPEDAHPVVGLAAALTGATGYTFVKLTPGHLGVLAQCLPDPVAASAGAARWLVVGGEQLTGEHLAFWREHAPQVMVANEYGHTETSVACVMECRPAGSLTESPVPVGRPFWNTQIYLVDDELNLVAPGVVGELLTGGVGVTRGYWGRPALTAEKFIPNPFGPGRLYRSGDLARYLPDGRLEFVSRIDRQVKVRGFRVELGEIESRLTEFPGVCQAVVSLRPGRGGVPRLVAHIESAAGLSTVDIKEFLRRRLPDHMIPEAFAVMARLPLTPNGKIDHARLPEPVSRRPR